MALFAESKGKTNAEWANRDREKKKMVGAGGSCLDRSAAISPF